MPRPTKLQIACKRAEEAALALDAAKKAYRTAQAEYQRQSYKSSARQRYEYAVLLIDQYGDAHDTYFHDTLAEARKDAVRWMNEPNDPDNDTKIVGVVIERILLSDLSRTTVQTHGKVAKEWLAS